jgi:hypothetical protein
MYDICQNGKKYTGVAATAKEINPFIELARTGISIMHDILISGIGLTASTYYLPNNLL